jgi:ADP-ribosyl-[dinitrogen reductase] hydrolase
VTKRRWTTSSTAGTGGPETPKDVGVQTRSVLSAAARRGISAQTAREESAALHEHTGRTAGNGSLMRTAPVALSHLDDEKALVKIARAISELTHYDPDAGDACVLWCTAIRHAILTGKLDAQNGLGHINVDRRDMWASRLERGREIAALDQQVHRLSGERADIPFHVVHDRA